MDGEKKEGKHICLDAKYLRGKSSGDILTKGKFVSTGDNIILVDGENSGEVFAVPHDGYMGSTFKQLWVSSNMHLPYVLFNIQFYKDLLRNSKKGAAIPHLNKDIFYSLVVGIPPYQELKRIAKRIEVITNRLKGSLPFILSNNSSIFTTIRRSSSFGGIGTSVIASRSLPML